MLKMLHYFKRNIHWNHNNWRWRLSIWIWIKRYCYYWLPECSRQCNFKKNTSYVKSKEQTDELKRILSYTLISEEVSKNKNNLFEGSTRKITVNAYERNQEARQQCLNKYGYIYVKFVNLILKKIRNNREKFHSCSSSEISHRDKERV